MKFTYPLVTLVGGYSEPNEWFFRARRSGVIRRTLLVYASAGKPYFGAGFSLKTREIDLKLARRAHALVGLFAFPLLVLLAAPFFAAMWLAKGIDKTIDFIGDAIFSPLGAALVPRAAWGSSFRQTFRRLWKLMVAR